MTLIFSGGVTKGTPCSLGRIVMKYVKAMRMTTAQSRSTESVVKVWVARDKKGQKWD